MALEHQRAIRAEVAALRQQPAARGGKPHRVVALLAALARQLNSYGAEQVAGPATISHR
jgi:hypothetical protein